MRLLPSRHSLSAMPILLLPLVLAAPTLTPAEDAPSRAEPPALVPWPHRLTPADGRMPLSDKSRIVTRDQALLPLARLLAGEIRLATGLRLPVEGADARARDVALALTADLKGEAYRLTITDRARVSAAGYDRAALGTAKL